MQEPPATAPSGALQRLWRSTAAMVGAAIIAQAINFFGTLAVARLYGPVEVGIFGLYTAVFSIVVFAASWRYEVAIVTVDADREANDVALFVFGAGITSAIIAAVGLL